MQPSKILKFFKNKTFFVAFILVIITLVFVLNSDNNKSRNSGKHYSYDSARMFLNTEIVGEYENPVGNTLLFKYFLKDTATEFKGLLNSYFKVASKQNNKLALAFCKILMGKIKLNEIGIDSFYKCEKEAFYIGSDLKDTNILLNSLGTLSTSYLMANEIDTGLYYSRLGYDIAMKSKKKHFIYFFAVNLGYVMNSRMLQGSAQLYFEQALKVSHTDDMNNLVLLNNMLSIMITEKNYSDAEMFWTKYFEKLKLDKSTYEGQLISINRALLYQGEKKWKESEKCINEIKNVVPVAQLKMNFLRVQLTQAENQNKDFSKLLFDNKQLILDEFPYSSIEIADYLLKEINSNPQFLSLNEFSNLEKQAGGEKELQKDYNNAPLYILKAGLYQNKGDFKNAYLISKIALDLKNKFYEVERESRHADLAEKMRLSNFLEQIESSKKELESQNTETRVFKIFTILLILLSFLILYVVYIERKRGVLREQLLVKELDNERLLAESLSTENDLNNRIITLSKMIISKVESINKLLSSINEVNYHSAIKEVRSEFLNIQNAVSHEQPQLADKLVEDYSNIQIDFPEISLLSITEKRIFVLSINGYPTKEIAGLLGLTSQYVNNARTSIRKKMGIEENWKEVLLNKKNPNLRSSE
jgi:hypothetical protein